MKQPNLTQKILLTVTILIVLISFACRKERAPLNKQSSSNNGLAFFDLSENKIRINQAVTIYDTSLITDTLENVYTPAGKYYEWKVIPDNECDSIISEKNKGAISFSFHCSGKYFITAKIYDSLTQNIIGNTDSLAINVTSDTLLQLQPIKEDDILNIKPSIVKRYSDTTLPPDEVWISLILSSTEHYNNYTPYKF